MDQVSKPVLIALAAVVVLLAAKFTVLRPKSDSGSTPAAATAPGQAGLQSAVDKANNAVGTSNAAASRAEQAAATASGDAAATPSAGTASTAQAAKSPAPKAAKLAKPLPELEQGDRSGPILRSLDNGKVVVALFFNPHGADDNAALRAVRAADRHHGRVIVHSIPIDDVGDYNALTSGVQVLQAPTVLVIGPSHKARTIVGYTEVKEIDQTVGDVGGKGFRAHPAKHLTGFAAKASDICQDSTFRFQSVDPPTDVPSLEHLVGRAIRSDSRDRRLTAGVPAVGAKQKAAKRALLNAYDADLSALATTQSKLKSGAAPGPVLLALFSAERDLSRKYRPALRAVNERHCLE